MKVAKLVYVTLLTRVIVDSEADDSDIMEVAVPKLCDSLQDSPMENIEKIVPDTECPYIIGEQQSLSIDDAKSTPKIIAMVANLTTEIIQLKREKAKVVDTSGSLSVPESEHSEMVTHFDNGTMYPTKKAMEHATKKKVDTDEYREVRQKETKPQAKKLEMKEIEFNVKPVVAKEVEFHKPKEFIF